jgi:hypothetical protein
MDMMGFGYRLYPSTNGIATGTTALVEKVSIK